ncbi:MAG: hypothetical protein M3O32_19095 [Actinomycetota bacterium]|nr:hypothetical protein [Actinomycetota bacterium]MDP9168145.1 hypothetical protein [Actinomycetota bacterium]
MRVRLDDAWESHDFGGAALVVDNAFHRGVLAPGDIEAAAASDTQR